MAENADVMGDLFRSELAKLQSPLIKTIREEDCWNAIVIDHRDPEAAWNLCLIMKENGLLAKPTMVIKYVLPHHWFITQEQILDMWISLKVFGTTFLYKFADRLVHFTVHAD